MLDLKCYTHCTVLLEPQIIMILVHTWTLLSFGDRDFVATFCSP